MRREDLDATPDGTVLDITPEEADELEASRRLAAELPVLAVMRALEAGRSPSKLLTPVQLRRQLKESFGRDVTIVQGKKIRTRRENH